MMRATILPDYLTARNRYQADGDVWGTWALPSLPVEVQKAVWVELTDTSGCRTQGLYSHPERRAKAVRAVETATGTKVRQSWYDP